MVQISADEVPRIIIWLLTTIASVSGLLNLMFLKGVLSEIKSLRETRHEHAAHIIKLRSDMEWLKHRARRSGDHDREDRDS